MEQTKRYKKGFVLGKFLPPHKGHLHLIHSAMQQVEQLTVLVCTIKKEPIAGGLRYHWMKELLPDANVIHVTDEVPSYPHGHSDFWKIWTALLKRNLDEDTEVFFSSEEYGNEVAERLGIQHVMIDQPRSTIPVSGTAVRNDPFANWHFIPGVVKPYFTKRIVLTGPESTGKTTMAQKLAEHFNTNWVAEYGRDYYVEQNGILTLEDFPKIAAGQIKWENEALQKANKILFCDTDVMVTQIWSEVYFNQCLPEVIDKSYERTYDLYLLMDIDTPWENDGTREFPHLRQWHFNRIKDELEKRGSNYVVVSGTYEKKFAFCVQQIERILAHH